MALFASCGASYIALRVEGSGGIADATALFGAGVALAVARLVDVAVPRPTAVPGSRRGVAGLHGTAFAVGAVICGTVMPVVIRRYGRHAVLWAGLSAAFFLYFARKPWRTLRWLAAVGALAFALAAVTLVPLLADWRWTTPYDDPWITVTTEGLLPRLLSPLFVAAGLGVLATVASTVHTADPCPELPEVFRDPLVVLKLAREVGHLDGVPPAETFRRTIERTLAPSQQHGWPFGSEIAGASAYSAGKAAHISGISVRGNVLAITLVKPAGDFLTRLSMFNFCPVPVSEPVDPKGATVPSAGPYYVASSTNDRTVLLCDLASACLPAAMSMLPAVYAMCAI